MAVGFSGFIVIFIALVNTTESYNLTFPFLKHYCKSEKINWIMHDASDLICCSFSPTKRIFAKSGPCHLIYEANIAWRALASVCFSFAGNVMVSLVGSLCKWASDFARIVSFYSNSRSCVFFLSLHSTLIFSCESERKVSPGVCSTFALSVPRSVPISVPSKGSSFAGMNANCWSLCLAGECRHFSSLC